MTMRSNTNDAARRAQTGISRATIREVDDNHLCQEVKQADVFHSETPTDFEAWEPVGHTSVVMKQKEQQQQGQQGQGGAGGGGGGGGGAGGGSTADWNSKQPKGESAEAIMMYANGSRAHPIALINDRRVRPYDMKPGEGSHYAADGSGQMLYHRVRGDDKDGLYILTLDDEGQQGGGAGGQAADGGGGQKSQKRFVSCRHVEKQKQSRKPQKQGQQGQGGGGAGAGTQAEGGGGAGGGGQQQHKHEGDKVNTETRWLKQKIEYYDGDKESGHYDRQKKDWLYHAGDASKSMRADQNHSHIKNGGGHIWVQNGCFSSMPIVIKTDPCK